MSDVLQRETRSKNRCRLVEDVAAKRLEYIDILMASIDTLSPEEFSQLMERQNEGLAKSRAEFLSVLMKKKQEPWVADVI
ncbi:hypothetical protein EPH_0005490 [Eimeria praecox]|uniref:Uncharacterized protein n=1 Tax=Eimeria praecox TaxID=51316 RepID=U6G5G4_9EIME|nr:hypothetical protein EPH_0005490 [Eimeria praecox]